ncbi:cytochrome P450 CYP82J17-like [Arachis stenosperma]|uniref:cytochrome P450 CYP82J17-like n=1 Tax=Arachis stenosperma TaxID=217475 RepID=UPI0025ACD16D|nr:cytochrome P450 CYP82J17-like [Arachis stenosperma]
MDFLSLPTVMLVASALVLLYNIWRIMNKTSEKQLQAPELPGAFPLIGHLHLLGTKTPLARTFASFSDKYGPIFRIRLGSYPAIVISNKDGIKECFTINDKALASRPKSSQGVYIGYNYAGFGFAPYGSFFIKHKKLATLELLSSRRVELSRYVYESEIDTLIKDLLLYSAGNSPDKVVVISEWLERLSFNIITKMIAGKRYFSFLQDVDDVEAHRVVKLIREALHLSGGGFVPSDVIPIIQWFGIKGKVLKSMKRIAKDLDTLLGSWVEEHRMKGNKVNSSSEKQDFIDVMLSVVEDDPDSGHTRDTIIKAQIMGILLAGTDTTSSAMIWMLALLLKNKHALKRAQEEINVHVGSLRKVEAYDMKNLVYLQAIFKETLRLYPGGPLLLPHEAREDCYINGYYVPKGTRVFGNVWKLHRDPSIWSEPDKFSPERFINANGEVDEDHHFEYLPFGLSRRVCPGTSLATQVSLITLARFLQTFHFDSPMDEPLDMREGLGLTLPKLTPLKIILSPQVSCELYP